MAASARDLVEFIARALVDEPERVDVREVQGDQARIIELRVSPADLGKVIGRQGRTAAAMRTLLQAGSGRQRTLLDIID